jgi:hypothetical protein
MRLALAVAGVGAVAVIGAVLYMKGTAAPAAHALEESGSGARLAAIAGTPVVTVVPFQNRTGDTTLNQVAALATDWVTQSLVQTGLVRVGRAPLTTERDSAARWLRVVGSVHLQRDSLHFLARLENPREGSVVLGVGPIAGAKDEPMPAVEALRQGVMVGLATNLDRRLTLWSKASQPPSYESYRHYLTGIELFTRGELRRAIPALLRAAGSDSRYAHALVAVAVSHAGLDEWASVDSIARALDANGGSLSPVDRSDVDWLLALARGDRYGAWQAARVSGALAPGTFANVQSGLEALSVNRVGEAVATLSAIDLPHSELANWQPYWHYLTVALHLSGDHTAELREARRARRLNPGAPESIVYEMRAFSASGLPDSALARLADLATLPPSPRRDHGSLFREAALDLRRHGHAAAAKRVLERGLAWYDARPVMDDRARLARARFLYDLERWTEARTLLDGLLAGANKSPGRGRLEPEELHGLLGVIAVRQSRASDAASSDAVLAGMREPYTFGEPEVWRAAIAAARGDKEQAVDHLRSALARGKRFSMSLHVAPELEPLRGYEPFDRLMKPTVSSSR